MISKKDIETIYSDCRAILLLQDDEIHDVLVDTLSSEYTALSDLNLNKIAIETGFRDVARFLKASDFFHVFKKGDRVMVRLASQKDTENKGKKKVICVCVCVWSWDFSVLFLL